MPIDLEVFNSLPEGEARKMNKIDWDEVIKDLKDKGWFAEEVRQKAGEHSVTGEIPSAVRIHQQLKRYLENGTADRRVSKEGDRPKYVYFFK